MGGSSLGWDCGVGARSRSNRRRAAVRGKPLLRVIVGRPRMLSLSGYRSSYVCREQQPLLRAVARALIPPLPPLKLTRFTLSFTLVL